MSAPPRLHSSCPPPSPSPRRRRTKLHERESVGFLGVRLLRQVHVLDLPDGGEEVLDRVGRGSGSESADEHRVRVLLLGRLPGVGPSLSVFAERVAGFEVLPVGRHRARGRRGHGRGGALPTGRRAGGDRDRDRGPRIMKRAVTHARGGATRRRRRTGANRRRCPARSRPSRPRDRRQPQPDGRGRTRRARRPRT